MNTLVDAWRRIIKGDHKSWVLFEHGTCVILMEPEQDLAAQARAIMAEWGPVHAGTPAGDFGVIHLQDGSGWAVYGHHPDMLTYVSRDELGPDPAEVAIGLHGRSKRDEDARTLSVVHVEDKRGRPEGA